MAANEQVRIDLEAVDRASAKIEDVADAVADLEDADAKVTLTAKDDASSTIADVEADTRALSGLDAEVVLKARADQARAELAGLRADLERTGEKAEDTARQMDRIAGDGGISTRGNAIADLTGPLGEASGAASDFAGVADGLTDIVGDLATKLGATPDVAAKISGALGGLGIAVAAGAAVWSLWSQRQREAEEAARQNAERVRDLSAAVEEGNRAVAVAKFHEVFGKAEKAAREAGIPVEEYAAFLTGAAEEMATATARQDELRAAYEAAGPAGSEARIAALQQSAAYFELTQVLVEARDKYAGTTDAVLDQAAADEDLADALVGTGKSADEAAAAQERLADRVARSEAATRRAEAALDDLKGSLNFEQAALNFATSFAEAMATAEEGTALTAQEVLDLKNDYLAVADELGKTPIEVQSDLERIEAGDIAAVLWETQSEINSRPPVTLKTKLGIPVNFGDERFYGPGGGPTAATSTVIVHQTIPRGFRGDVLAEARRAAARSGRLYRSVG
jgi:hypothetical protein